MSYSQSIFYSESRQVTSGWPANYFLQGTSASTGCTALLLSFSYHIVTVIKATKNSNECRIPRQVGGCDTDQRIGRTDGRSYADIGADQSDQQPRRPALRPQQTVSVTVRLTTVYTRSRPTRKRPVGAADERCDHCSTGLT